VGTSRRFDVAVIGAGPGGYVAAIRAAQLGRKVAIVEAERPGGVCLHWGCIPSKALLTAASLVDSLRSHSETFGITMSGLQLDLTKAIEHSRTVTRQLGRGVLSLFEKNRIELIRGYGRLVAPTAPEVSTSDGSRAGSVGSLVEADHIILATGSRDKVPEGVSVDGTVVMTSREALTAGKSPRRLIVVGGGAVGIELAYVYAMYGADVELIEMEDQLLPGADREVAETLRHELRRKGLRIHLNTRFQEMKVQNGEARLTITSGEGESELRADRVLLAIGRKPLSDDLGLEDVGIECDADGFIPVDANHRTRIPTISAIGDLAGVPLLAHKASEEGVAVAELLAGMTRRRLEPHEIPTCIYSQPQVAWIGRTELQARALYGDDVRVGVFPFTASGRATGAAERAGFAKIIAEPEYGEIVGAHVVGCGATELVSELTLAMRMEATTGDIARVLHPHPSLSEAILEATLAAEGQALHL